MKIFATSIIVFFLVFSAFSQNDKLQRILSSDTILHQVYHKLPKGWTMSMDDTSLTIYKIEKYAFINTDCSLLSQDSLNKLPKTETAMIRFLYEDRWDNERLFWIRESNDSLNMILSSLAQQMGITQFYDADKSTRSNKVYTGKTKADKEKINAYYKRRAQLLQQITPIPTFYTSTLSLIQRKQTGLKKAGECIYPFDVYKELLEVNIILMDYCINPLNER